MDSKRFNVQTEVGYMLRVNRERVKLSLDQVAEKFPIISAKHLKEIEECKRSVPMRIIFILFTRVYRPTISEVLYFCTNGHLKPDYLA